MGWVANRQAAASRWMWTKLACTDFKTTAPGECARRGLLQSRGSISDEDGSGLVNVLVVAVAAPLLVVLRLLGDQGIAGEEQRRDRGGVLQRRSRDLGGVDDAALH